MSPAWPHWDIALAAGAAVLVLLALLWGRSIWTRRRRENAYQAAAPGVDTGASDPRYASPYAGLDSEEDLEAARLSVRVEPRAALDLPAPADFGTPGAPISPAAEHPTPLQAQVQDTRLFQQIAEVRGAPESAKPFRKLGQALAARGLYHVAAVAFRQALRREEQALTFFYLAVCCDLLGRRTWARQALKLAVRERKNFSAAHTLLGYLALREEDPAGAAVHLARAMALDPGRPEPHLGLGWIHAQRGEMEEAVWEFEAAANAAPSFGPAVDAVRDGIHPAEVVRWEAVFGDAPP